MTDQPTAATTLDIEIFDPPLCCPTGLCGPVLDTTLVDLSEAIMHARGRGPHRRPPPDDERPPGVHAQPRRSTSSSRQRQLEALPITVVRGQVVKTDAYPSLDELRAALAAGA